MTTRTREQRIRKTADLRRGKARRSLGRELTDDEAAIILSEAEAIVDAKIARGDAPQERTAGAPRQRTQGARPTTEPTAARLAAPSAIPEELEHSAACLSRGVACHACGAALCALGCPRFDGRLMVSHCYLECTDHPYQR